MTADQSPVPNRNPLKIKTPRWWHIVLLAIGLFVATALLHGDYIVSSDEGGVINAAWQLWNGLQLYTDVKEFTPPGSAWFILAGWQIFGEPSYVLTALVSMCMLTLSAIGVWGSTYRYTAQWSASLLASGLWLLASRGYVLINHNTYSSILAVGVLGMLLHVTSKQSAYSAVRYSVLGFLLGLTLIVLHTKGILLLLACLLAIWWTQRTQFKSALAMLLAGLIIPVLPVLSLWHPLVLWEAWFLLPWQNSYLAYSVFQTPVLVLQIVILLGMFLLWRQERASVFGILLICQTALWLSSANLIDVGHMLVNSFPAGIALVLWINRILPKQLLMLAASMVSLLVLTAGSVITISRPTIWNPASYPTASVPALRHSAIQEADYVFAGPFVPGIYFELRKPNPFTETHNFTLCDDVCQQATVSTLETVQPEYALLDYSIVEQYGYNQDNLLDNYISEHYTACPNQNSSLQVHARELCPEFP